MRLDWHDIQKHLSPTDIAVEFLRIPISNDSVVYVALTLQSDSEMRGEQQDHPGTESVFKDTENRPIFRLLSCRAAEAAASWLLCLPLYFPSRSICGSCCSETPPPCSTACQRPLPSDPADVRKTGKPKENPPLRNRTSF